MERRGGETGLSSCRWYSCTLLRPAPRGRQPRSGFYHSDILHDGVHAQHPRRLLCIQGFSRVSRTPHPATACAPRQWQGPQHERVPATARLPEQHIATSWSTWDSCRVQSIFFFLITAEPRTNLHTSHHTVSAKQRNRVHEGIGRGRVTIRKLRRPVSPLLQTRQTQGRSNYPKNHVEGNVRVYRVRGGKNRATMMPAL